MTRQEMMDWIDNASYEQLLCKWRFAPIGDPFFQGAMGDYYAEVLSRRRNEDPARHVQASKNIGWER